MAPGQLDVGREDGAGWHPSASAISRDHDQLATAGDHGSRGPVHVRKTASGLNEDTDCGEVLVESVGGTRRRHRGDESRSDHRIVRTTERHNRSRGPTTVRGSRAIRLSLLRRL